MLEGKSIFISVICLIFLIEIGTSYNFSTGQPQVKKKNNSMCNTSSRVTLITKEERQF